MVAKYDFFLRASRLESPIFLFSLGLLLLNDHLFKGLLPGWLTGKLSDFSGIFALYYFSLAFLPLAKRRIQAIICIAWIWWKLPISSPFIEFWNGLGLISIGRVLDVSDILALIVLLAPIQFEAKSGIRARPLFSMPLLAVSLFAFTATSVSSTYLSKKLYVDPVTAADSIVSRLKREGLELYYRDEMIKKFSYDKAIKADSSIDSLILVLEKEGLARRFFVRDPMNERAFAEVISIVWSSDCRNGYGVLKDTVLVIQQVFIAEGFFNKYFKGALISTPKMIIPNFGLWGGGDISAKLMTSINMSLNNISIPDSIAYNFGSERGCFYRIYPQEYYSEK